MAHALAHPSPVARSFDPNDGVRTSAFLPAALAFSAGLLSPFKVDLVGAMPLGEFILLGTLALVVLSVLLTQSWPAGLLRSPLLKALLLCQAVAFTGYIVADLSRGSSSHDMIRGWARMVFLALDLWALAALLGDGLAAGWRTFVAFQAGYALGSAGEAMVGEVLFNDYWKFGYAIPVTLAALLVAPRFGLLCAVAVAAGLGVVHFVLDFRSMAGICLLLACALALQGIPVRFRLFAAPVGAILGLALIGFGYVLSQSGPSEGEGRSARSDVERTAMLQAAWEGFCRSPWIGNGSWFSNSDVMEQFFAIRYERSMAEHVGTFSQDDETNGGIALHSQILVGLAEGGVFGGLFFAAYGVALLWALGWMALFREWDAFSPIGFFTLLFGLWSLAMSPFSGMHRILIAVAVGVILLLWRERTEQQSELDSIDSAEGADPTPR